MDRIGLKMQLVEVEHIFGGERIVVYYLAENRVDFRELVKALAGEFQTRIEMRQIGVRDEAKLSGRLWRLRLPRLLQHSFGADAAGVDADGQAAEGYARPHQDFGTLRAIEVLSALRIRDVRAVAANASRRGCRLGQPPIACGDRQRAGIRSRSAHRPGGGGRREIASNLGGAARSDPVAAIRPAER